MTPRRDLRLGRMRRLLELDGDPQTHFRSVLVAGTKGKGSTAAMIAAMAQAAGLRTFVEAASLCDDVAFPRQDVGQQFRVIEFVRIIKRLVSPVDSSIGVAGILAQPAAELGKFSPYEQRGPAFHFFNLRRTDLRRLQGGVVLRFPPRSLRCSRADA